MQVRESLDSALTAAKITKTGSREAAIAWETVEELESEISHLKKRC
jgi:hypothetical protein